MRFLYEQFVCILVVFFFKSQTTYFKLRHLVSGEKKLSVAARAKFYIICTRDMRDHN